VAMSPLMSGCVLLIASLAAFSAQATTYYVSSSEGDDINDGLSEDYPFETIARVNALSLVAGDNVLLKCGDVWRAEQLLIDMAGTAAQPISFGSYPAGCLNQPALSGAQPIVDWVHYGGSIYYADLDAGGNAGLFPLGISQLFRNGQRLPFGRWPNIDAGDGGYAFVDGYPATDQITDNELPAGSWTGAVIRIKTQRWLLINREVVGSSGTTLTLNESIDCRGATCVGWGFFIQNHLATVDEDGEWYHDAASNRVYMCSPGGVPGGIEGSVVLDLDTRFIGGVMIGAGAEHVRVENLLITRWFNHGVGAAGSMQGDVYHDIAFVNNTIRDVDAAGVMLNTWIWNAANGRDGLRGGYGMVFSGNTIDGANHFGITGYPHTSTFEHNEIRNIGLIANLNLSGMGCGTTGASCTENGDGLRIRRYLVEDSGHSNLVRYNRVERTGYNGLDVFGPFNTVEYNLFSEPCFSKGDCGGVRTFGDTSLAETEVHDITLRSNIVVDSYGNVDGVKVDYRQPFGMGLYIDNYSRDVEAVGNTVIRSTITGILFQRSTGVITANTLYDCSCGTMYSGHVGLADSQTVISSMVGNVLYGLDDNAWTLALDEANLLASDHNYFFHPYVDKQITTGGWAGRKTFEEWQSYSGMDVHSKDNWFVLSPGDPPLSVVFANDTESPQEVSLGDRQYLDLDQNPVVGSVTLDPFTSVVLVDNGPAAVIFCDDFESGGVSMWSFAVP
jgi:hypothetical protein